MRFEAIFSSYDIAECEQRAFVLKAVGVAHLIESHEEQGFVLVVPASAVATAMHHLQRYEEESRPKPLPPSLQLHGNAWVGSVLYAALLLAVAYGAGAPVGNIDWFEIGALTHAAVSSHEWWRVITALTLHADVAHLVGNLAFGIPYGFFAAQLLGTGRAWGSILLGAAIGNLFDASLMSPQQATIGASTAVFSMLGLVAAYSWRLGAQTHNVRRWAHRWAPLVAALALLAVTGAGGERTDVTAHLGGFFSGVAIGALQAHLPGGWWHRRTIQSGTGIVVLAVTLGAWWWALAAA